MDQYLYIPFLGGWTSIYQLFWCSPGVQGFDTLPCGRTNRPLRSGPRWIGIPRPLRREFFPAWIGRLSSQRWLSVVMVNALKVTGKSVEELNITNPHKPKVKKMKIPQHTPTCCFGRDQISGSCSWSRTASSSTAAAAARFWSRNCLILRRPGSHKLPQLQWRPGNIRKLSKLLVQFRPNSEDWT